jgi:hypothetical protein
MTSSWFYTREYTLENVSGISDLFDMGYRRFNIDLYWDNTTSTFQLCPVQITLNTTTNTTSLTTTTFTVASTVIEATTTTTVEITLTHTLPAAPTATLSPPDSLLPISLPGNYTCTPAADFQSVLSTISSILVRTDNLREAGLIILVLNLYDLNTFSTNNTIANTIADLSNSTAESLSAQINDTIGNWIYTPVILDYERSNINNTFLADPENPITDVTAYYNITIDPETNIASTDNGWPTTRYLFESNGRRMLIGFGSVNVPSEEYSIAQDSPVIFPAGTFGAANQLIDSSAITNTPQACLGPEGPVFGPHGQVNFNSSTTGMDGNMTFAYSQDSTSLTSLTYDNVQDTVLCGLSPLIDSPMQNTNSGVTSPYNPVAATVWSWLAPDQPVNVTLTANGTTENLDACAAFDADSGRWVVLNCDTQLQIACRANNSLYSVIHPHQLAY